MSRVNNTVIMATRVLQDRTMLYDLSKKLIKLIKFGANPLSENKYGKLPLQIATDGVDEKLIAILENSAD
ncbi:hypothetical protein KQI86_07735 [Clostridium sp. MSJ-11]|uniref:Uncharacterized protein n=1 Tax=Clostridium mobile TaxID=2841512 RepID=A0ABS6EG75_9CLOT|nr:hypothetical protein [Clostridium mobile]MBU5484218.1 hypothetical protein [Clostridium mobile]